MLPHLIRYYFSIHLLHPFKVLKSLSQLKSPVHNHDSGGFNALLNVLDDLRKHLDLIGVKVSLVNALSAKQLLTLPRKRVNDPVVLLTPLTEADARRAEDSLLLLPEA